MSKEGWIRRLRAKADAGTISQAEFVRLYALQGGLGDAELAREIYRTSYAAKHRPGYGITGVS